MGAIGFGAKATGGTEPFTVTTLDDSGPGSLRDALSAEGRDIGFAARGTIQLSTPLMPKSNTTIFADGGGVTLLADRHALLPSGYVSNLVIRNLNFRTPLSHGIPRSPEETQLYGNRIALAGPIKDVWIDGCTFSHVGGKAITMWDGTTGITISNCKFYSSFYAILAGCTHTMPQSEWPRMEITVMRNLFSGIKRRSPKCASGVHMHAFNNVIETWGSTRQDYGSGSGDRGQLFLENNIYDPGKTANSVAAYDCGKETDDGGFGYIRAAGNLMIGGCSGTLHQPARVFKPPYDYKAKAATAALRKEVSS